jgi:hypothetical protein
VLYSPRSAAARRTPRRRFGQFFIRAEAPSLSAKDCRAEYAEAVRHMSSSWKWKNPSSVENALGSIAEAFPSLGGTVKELREASPQAGS